MSFDDAKYEARRLAALRDEVEGKILFGLISLNAGSAIALPTVFNALGAKAASTGLQTPFVTMATAAFITGICISGHALRTYNILLIKEAGRHAQVAHLRANLLHANEDPAGDEEFQTTIAELKTLSAPENSDNVIDAEYLAGGLWTLGIIIIVIDLLDKPVVTAAKNFMLWLSEHLHQ